MNVRQVTRIITLGSRCTALLVCLLGVCSTAPAVIAREASRKTIVDYYLTLPMDGHFGPFAEDKQKRLAEMAKVDRQNGYLRLRSDNAESSEMKLYRMSDGTVLIGQGYTGCCCEGSCFRMIRFLAARNGTFENVTSEVWPRDEQEMREKAARRLLPRAEPWEKSDLVDQAVYRLSRTSTAVYVESGWLRPGKWRLLDCHFTGKKFVCR